MSGPARTLAVEDADAQEVSRHDVYISNVIEQMVRRESYLTNRQSPKRRALERFVLGDARKRGETHQWMYDRYSLRRLLEQAGFKNVQVKIAFESQITDWEKFDLDGSNGILRKPDSLFVEAIK